MTVTFLPRKFLPLSIQMILLSIVAGCMVFFFSDLILGIQVERSFREQLIKKLHDQALEGRTRFDHYVKSHYQLTQLIVSQQSFQDHINQLPKTPESPRVNKRTPGWLPKRSILRSMAPASYYLLFDEKRTLLESYQTGLDPLPEQLRHPDYHLVSASHNENFITSINGVPFIVSSETSQGDNDRNTTTLLLASPIDDTMLLALMPPYSTRQIVVMSTGFAPYVVSSSNGELIPKGKKISELKDDYLIFGEKVFNYEYTDLMITYNHLMPISAVKELTEPIMKRQRTQLVLISVAFIFSFSLIIVFIGRRIQSLTRDVVAFSQTFTGKESDEFAKGDEITTLKQQFDFLTKEMLASTRQQASLLQSILKAIPTPIFYKDINGKYIGCNKAFEKLHHLSKEEIVGKTVFDILPKEQAEKIDEADRQLFTEGGTQISQSALPDKDGLTYEGLFHRAIFKKGDGSTGGLVGAIMDITNIKKVKDDLSYANALLKSLLDSIPDLVFYKDTEGVYLGCNRAFSEFVSRSEENVVGHTDFDFFPEDITAFFREQDSKMLATGTSRRNEEWVNYPDGRKVLLDTLKTSMYGPDGENIGLIGISRDITERYQAEEQRKTDYKRFKTVLDSFDSLIYVADMESYELLFLNKYGREIWGDIKGQTCWETLQEGQEGPCSFCTNAKLLNSEGNPTGGCVWEFQNTVTNDWFECRDKAIPWTDGRYVRLEIASSINERKNAEQDKEKLQTQLRQAQKMEAVGTLAGGIAHDFNNILSAIIGYTELAQLNVAPESNISGDLENVKQAGLRAKELVKQILAFSRQTEQDFHPVMIAMIVKEALKLLRASIPTTIEIKQNISPDCGNVLADPVQIHQIIMNLCTNSYHAMREHGGVLGVSLTSIIIDAEDAKVRNKSLKAGKYNHLSISDTGIGMDKILMDRIFEPYFTTKEKGKGTGMGLAVVHGIIKSVNGHIEVNSTPGEGTTVHVFLPQISEQKTDHTPKAESVPRGHEHLMIVDDEQHVTSSLQRTFESLGYQVTPFTNSLLAYQEFSNSPNSFDLIITDMTMPGFTGAELATRILAMRPQQPIMMCTGFSDLIDEDHAKKIGIKEFVLKPVIRADIAQTVRKILDADN